ncbi:MAG: ribonuclease III [Lentisphaerae bacterium]|nr:MAG: ribonuclease III [Lentisphaerota bacterium]
MEKPIEFLQEALQYRFNNPDLLLEALSHPSYCAEHETYIPNNQRLEFLGDAVLDLVVGTWLYEEFRDWNEGLLTRARASLTRSEALTAFAEKLQLGDYLRLGVGEEQNGGRTRPSNLCDAFEAVVGAVYLDCGKNPDRIWEIFAPFFQQYQGTLGNRILFDNPKGLLQEVTQRMFHQRPTYEIIEVDGPEHHRQYTCQVYFQEQVMGVGKGKRIREAEQEAAVAALQKLTEEYGIAILPSS